MGPRLANQWVADMGDDMEWVRHLGCTEFPESLFAPRALAGPKGLAPHPPVRRQGCTDATETQMGIHMGGSWGLSVSSLPAWGQVQARTWVCVHEFNRTCVFVCEGAGLCLFGREVSSTLCLALSGSYDSGPA